MLLLKLVTLLTLSASLSSCASKAVQPAGGVKIYKASHEDEAIFRAQGSNDIISCKEPAFSAYYCVDKASLKYLIQKSNQCE